MTTEMSMGRLGAVVNCNPRPEVPDLPQWVADLADRLAIAPEHVRRRLELEPLLLVGTPYDVELVTDAIVGQASRINRDAVRFLIQKYRANQRPKTPQEFLEPEKAPTKSLATWEGHSITAILRWMGVNGWGTEDAKGVLGELGFTPADNTIASQFRAGKKGEREPAEITPAQQKKLLQILAKI